MPLLGQVEVCKKSHCQDICQVTWFLQGLKATFAGILYVSLIVLAGRTSKLRGDGDAHERKSMSSTKLRVLVKLVLYKTISLN